MAHFVSKIPVPVTKNAPSKPPRDSKIAESTRPAKSSISIDVQRPDVSEPAPRLTTPPPEPTQLAEREEEEIGPRPVEHLNEDHVHALFSGAPHFFVQNTERRPIPRVTFPWDEDLVVKDVSDSVQLSEPAFSAVTLHRHLPALHQASDQDKPYQGCDLDVFEVPNMLSAQGIEPVSKSPPLTIPSIYAHSVIFSRVLLASRTSSSYHNPNISLPISSNPRPATNIWRHRETNN